MIKITLTRENLDDLASGNLVDLGIDEFFQIDDEDGYDCQHNYQISVVQE